MEDMYIIKVKLKAQKEGKNNNKRADYYNQYAYCCLVRNNS